MSLRRHHALLRDREGGRPAQGRLLQRASDRPPDHRRATGRPGRLPPENQLLGGQPGRDHHDHPHRGGLPGRPRHRRARHCRRRRHALSGQPDGPGRREAAVHRLEPAPPGPQATWRPTSTGKATPPPTGRSSTPSPPKEARTPSGTRTARPSRCGTRTPTQAHGGPSGPAPRSERPGTTRPSQLRPTAPGPSVAGEKQPRRTRFVTVHQGDQVLDETSIARARPLVGLKGYVTNIPAFLHA